MSAATLALFLLASCSRPQERGVLTEGWLTRNAANAPEEEALVLEEVETAPLQLGSTSFIMDVPVTYARQEIQPEAIRQWEVASYDSLEYLVDFDVYEIPKTVAPTLSELADMLVERARDAQGSFEAIGNLQAFTYTSTIAFDGLVYDTVAVVAEDADVYLRVVFWLDRDDYDLSLLKARRMMESLRVTSVGEDMAGDAQSEVPDEAQAEADASVAPDTEGLPEDGVPDELAI